MSSRVASSSAAAAAAVVGAEGDGGAEAVALVEVAALVVELDGDAAELWSTRAIL